MKNSVNHFDLFVFLCSYIKKGC